MTIPDYPLMAIPSYEMYQLAHIATFIADGLARRRAAWQRGDRRGSADASRDVAGGNAALRAAMGTHGEPGPLPRPLDAATFDKVSDLLKTGERRADVVSLASLGRSTWAVIGHVPGIGAVGAEVTGHHLADAVRQHILTQPVGELAAWAIAQKPHPTGIKDRVDLAAFVEGLDPGRLRDQAVARHLRGTDRRTDAAIHGRFAGVDLDAPLVDRPPTPAPPTGAAHDRPSPPQQGRFLCGVGRQTTARPATAPARSAGP
ncbi:MULTISPECIES: hypothetical protein [unclassified Pseudonocardia]|uniref:hypothetical protein n=1 Tax=unclassified Pseudonocardia TaxID=2619320 RepID=UPI00095EAF8D|nr:MULTISPECIES: hypothetical protein [unclassified Pseudonocardia]MBN9103103.1 hypothetical protein [Pseudonocardia sp.]OJY41579.1 MAG: hypothetical protein BGP03_20480 [Pseudonocardia sp. 73-21]